MSACSPPVSRPFPFVTAAVRGHPGAGDYFRRAAIRGDHITVRHRRRAATVLRSGYSSKISASVRRRTFQHYIGRDCQPRFGAVANRNRLHRSDAVAALVGRSPGPPNHFVTRATVAHHIAVAHSHCPATI